MSQQNKKRQTLNLGQPAQPLESPQLLFIGKSFHFSSAVTYCIYEIFTVKVTNVVVTVTAVARALIYDHES